MLTQVQYKFLLSLRDGRTEVRLEVWADGSYFFVRKNLNCLADLIGVLIEKGALFRYEHGYLNKDGEVIITSGDPICERSFALLWMGHRPDSETLEDGSFDLNDKFLNDWGRMAYNSVEIGKWMTP